MDSETKGNPMGDIPDAYMGLVRAQVAWGQEVFQALTGASLPKLEDPWKFWERAWKQAVNAKRVCHVPPPCWMPRKLGECVSHVSACSRACVRIVVTNCDRVSRSVSVRTDGDEGVEVHPTAITLSPMQRATFEVCREVPREVKPGTAYESLIWVEGCRQHVLRWTVSVGTAGLDSCHEVQVEDCPDHRHHWYDHFYCVRPCQDRRIAQNV